MKLICLCLIACLISVCPAWADEPQADRIDQSLLPGNWLAHQFESEAGKAKPLIEFRKGGAFWIINQFGKEKSGVWRWNSPGSLELFYPAQNKRVHIKILELTKNKLVTKNRRQTEYIRVKGAPDDQAANNTRPLTVDDLQQNPVIGKIGVPLGEVVWIEATVIAGRELRLKRYSGRYLLKVTSAKGKLLPEPQIMEFGVSGFSKVKNLPNESFGLYKMRHGKKPKSLNSEQIKQLEQGYVGKKVALQVYETGVFSGIPKSLPEGMVWQDTGYGFFSHLVVVGRKD